MPKRHQSGGGARDVPLQTESGGTMLQWSGEVSATYCRFCEGALHQQAMSGATCRGAVKEGHWNVL